MKIVLTGGPCAGKTTISDILVKTFSKRLAIVPEAASILFQGGFPRPNGQGNHCQQRAIYYVQKELETLVALEDPSRALICDRGSLDGAAYWSGTLADFYSDLQTSESAELARYRWVIHLDTAGMKEYRRTPVRVEDFASANEMNTRIKQAWSNHPHRLIIPHDDNFARKVESVVQTVSKLLNGGTLS